MAESRRMHRLSGRSNEIQHAEIFASGRPGRKCGKSRFAAARCYMTPPGPATPAASWFDPIWWSRRGEVRDSAEGRGAALFIEADGRQLVLRHYRRGGWIASWSTDRYLWQGGALTRSFIEWHLLYVMRRAGLPVPMPIAACYRRSRPLQLHAPIC